MDYSVYEFSKEEWIKLVIGSLLFNGVISYLFYNSILLFFLLMPMIFIYSKLFKKSCMEKRMAKLNYDFKETMVALVAALNAGYSLENAFASAKQEMSLMNEGKESDMQKELDLIVRKIGVNMQIEELLIDLANRTGLEDINNFAQVVCIAKRSGGNLIKIIKKTVDNIAEKIEMNREIQTVIAAKKFEQKIMSIMPFFIMAYIRVTNPEYVTALYGNVAGILVMTVCLVCVALACVWSRKIIDIEV